MEEKFENTAVIDASFMLCYLMPDEHLEEVQKVFEKYKKGELRLISVQLFPFEVINGLYSSVLSKRLVIDTAGEIILDFLKLPITLEKVDYYEVFETACKYKISIYDASYIYLASIMHQPFFTLDKKLLEIKY